MNRIINNKKWLNNLYHFSSVNSVQGHPLSRHYTSNDQHKNMNFWKTKMEKAFLKKQPNKSINDLVFHQFKGAQFEKYMKKMLIAEGRWFVRHDVTLKDANGNRSQIDLIYGWGPFKRYVECKCYSGPIPLESVAKFKEVLRLNKIPVRRGHFFTTSTYTPRSTSIGIRCYNGKQLAKRYSRAMKRSRNRTIRRSFFWLFLILFSLFYYSSAAEWLLYLHRHFLKPPQQDV
mmetsp:Transcript_10457/g.15284  ORF Transcript_10457/g.15284 Transcript_10457/m.15284 type:complete len:231 (-) Transcript_10457:109-801(-)